MEARAPVWGLGFILGFRVWGFRFIMKALGLKDVLWALGFGAYHGLGFGV